MINNITNSWHKEDILIVVKTYPTPSSSYQETVCTAGITRSGKWIRLYPINFRILEDDQKYKKYQWIAVDVKKKKDDFRPESYLPNNETIETLATLNTKDRWAERKRIILSTAEKSLESISDLYKANKISLGLFKPKAVTDLIWEACNPEWSNKQKNSMMQSRLFTKEIQPLEKIPYTFRYTFTCNDLRCRGHSISFVDWEINQAYRKWKYRYASEAILLKKIKEKFLDSMFSEKRDPYLIVGTKYPYPTFLIIGVFWPPK